MFAVIKAGGKQYRVAADDVIKVEKIVGEPGDIVELGQVLMISGDKGVEVGSPHLAGVTVAAEVLDQEKTDTIIIFKKRRRHHYRRRNGHRQSLTALKITEILTDGRKPQAKKAVKPAAPAPKPEKAAASEAAVSEPGRAAETKPAKKAPAKRAKTQASAKLKSSGKAKPRKK
jgi:large subunit ribosomal protein L21